MSCTKEELRTAIRQQLDSISAEQRAAWSQAICRKLAHHPLVEQAKTILAYAPLAQEVDIWPLIHEWYEQGKTVLLPRVETDHSLSLHPYEGNESLRKGSYGIMEPTTPEINGKQVDLMIVPGLEFTSSGARLGRGGGYYDRLLSRLSAYSIGIGFPFQLVAELPTEKHDKPVNETLIDNNH